MKKRPSPQHMPSLLDVPLEALHGHLQICTEKKDLTAGSACYDHLVRIHLERKSFWGDHLIRLLAACGRLPESAQVFDRIISPTVYTWNAIISAHVCMGDAHGAIEYYHGMQLNCIQPDRVTLLCMLKACISLSDSSLGQMIHIRIIEQGLSGDHIMANALIDMLSKVGRLEEARTVFDSLTFRDKVSWGSLIAGYVQHRHPQLALDLYENMQKFSTEHDRVILLSVAKAVACTGVVEIGMVLHDIAVKGSVDCDVMLGSTLIDMYAKCNCMEEAQNLFDRLPKRNVVSWGALIGGFSSQKQDVVVCYLYSQMHKEGVQADRVIFLCVLKACGSLGALWQGRLIDDLIRRSMNIDVVLGSALVEMYVLCGSIEDAHKVVVDVDCPNNIIWAMLIGGYAICGNQSMVMKCLATMQQQGLRPDHIIFTSVLASCSHSGSLDVGYRYFDFIGANPQTVSSVELYTCMVDLFGRAGQLDAASCLVKTMPVFPDSITRRSYLMGRKIHMNSGFRQQRLPNHRV